tara:strand:+ start:256 stop:633 length:378 start_codon:yes stop_codon:yes gene_type:complete
VEELVVHQALLQQQVQIQYFQLSHQQEVVEEHNHLLNVVVQVVQVVEPVVMEVLLVVVEQVIHLPLVHHKEIQVDLTVPSQIIMQVQEVVDTQVLVLQHQVQELLELQVVTVVMVQMFLQVSQHL